MDANIVIISIFVFYYVLLSIILYVLIVRIHESYENRILRKIQSTFGVMVKEQLNRVKNGEALREDELEEIKNLIKKPNYFKIFNNVYVDFVEKKENIVYGKKYIEPLEATLANTFFSVNKKHVMKFAYYIYLVGEYRISSKIILDELLENLNSPAIYIRVNALKAISKIGNETAMLNALRILSLREKAFNEKVVIDCIDTFEGDIESLDEALLKELNRFTLEIKNIIISHFTNKEYRECIPKLKKLLISTKTPLEEKIRIIRYFARIKENSAEDILISLLDDEAWEVRAVAVKTLKSYNISKAYYKIKSLMGDVNWHVRYNSAMTLISRGKNTPIVESVLNGEDRYAKEILTYAMFTKNLITYEEYIASEEAEKAMESVAAGMEGRG